MANENPARPYWGPLLSIALWFGIVTGLIEGAGLMLFQNINWAQWGRLIHVSWKILWISPLVDAAFFLLLALLVSLAARIFRRIPAVTALVFLLSSLAVYDWLSLTDRLYRLACLLLALGAASAFLRWFRPRQLQALRFWKRTTPLVAVLFLLVAAGVQSGLWFNEHRMLAELPPAAPDSPNVLVIIVDTLRADHVSAYGYKLPTTPNLDRLAQQGVLFETAISPCSYSLPSHVSLVTGRYQFEHGVGNVQPLPWFSDKETMGGYATIGEVLQRRGYRTAAFSANRTYFTHELQGRGFIHFEDYFNSPADMFLRTVYGRKFCDRFLRRSEKSLFTRAFRRVGLGSLLDHDDGGFGIRKRANAVNREFLRWVQAGPPRPFLVFMNYFDVHRPYGGPYAYPRPTWQEPGTIGEYDEGVNYVDDALGNLMKDLARRNLTRNLLLVVTSDHGEGLGQHGVSTHDMALYWELVHVPLVFWYPGHVPAGERIAAPVTNSAIVSTVMDLLGGNTPAAFPGPPLDALWQNPSLAAAWPAPLSELAQDIYPDQENRPAMKIIPTNVTGWMKSLVIPQYQLIVHQKAGNQLYDWVQDPGELHDLVATPEGKAEAEKLRSRMQSELVVRPPAK
jgi:arylsulfatase A-like enzyme